MKNTFTSIKAGVLLSMVFLMSACQVSKDFAGARLVKKRYSKGYYIDFGTSSPRARSMETIRYALVDSTLNGTNTEQETIVEVAEEAMAVDSAQADDRQPALVDAPVQEMKEEIVAEPALSNSAPVCDTLELKSGKMIKVKIASIGPDKVMYRMCNDPEGLALYYYSRQVKQIRKGSGEKLVFSQLFSEQEMKSSSPIDERKYDPFAVASFILGLLSFSVILAPVAIIFGIIALKRIERNPDRLYGKWMAWAGIGLGALVAVIYLGALLASVAFF